MAIIYVFSFFCHFMDTRKKTNGVIMYKNEYVYCTKCANFNTDFLTPSCKCEAKCYFWDWEDSKPKEKRPYYEEKEGMNYVERN